MDSREELRYKLNMVLQIYYQVNPIHINENAHLSDLLDLDNHRIDRMVLEFRMFFRCDLTHEEIKNLTDIKSLLSTLEKRIEFKMEIIEILYEIIEKHSGISRVEIYPEMRLVKDLGLGPISKMEMLFELEESFGIHIPPNKVIEIKRVSDLLRMLNRK